MVFPRYEGFVLGLGLGPSSFDVSIRVRDTVRVAFVRCKGIDLGFGLWSGLDLELVSFSFGARAC